MRRGSRARAVALAASVAALTLVILPTSATAADAAPLVPSSSCLCGTVLGDGGAVDAPDTLALVQWSDNVETIDLAVRPRAKASPVGLIVPTPAVAKVSAGDPADFAALASATQPRAIVEDDWWGRSGDPAVASDDPVPAAGALKARDVRANDVATVRAWADDHGLAIDDATAKKLSAYHGSGWAFSLVTLNATSEGLDPVHLRFASSLRVFPLLLGAASESPAALRLYVAGDHRVQLVQHTRSEQPLDAAETVAWAGPTAGTSAARFGDYLTVIDVHVDDPSAQIGTDMRIVDAVADESVQPTHVVVRPIRLLGIPLGWLMIVWGSLGAAIGVVALGARLRAR